MKYILLATLILSGNALASVRTFKAVTEKATLDLEQKKGEPNVYYGRVTNLDTPNAGRTVLLKRTERLGAEEFSGDGADFAVRLGGSYAKQYAKPMVAGILIAGINRDIPMTPDTRTVDLAADYLRTECLDLTDKAKAEEELTSALNELKKMCGGNQKLNVNWSTFSDPPKACNGRNFIMGLSSLCSDADYKSAAAGVKEIRLQGGKTTAFSKSGDAFVYSQGPDASNTLMRSRRWFEENL